ncbi:hypothetical protein G3219_11895 [Vibrio parahaemolyticus]|nr:hypothetical protein [Vibrio parahaemolyticus]
MYQNLLSASKSISETEKLTAKETKARFLQTQMTQNRIAKPSQKHMDISLNILFWVRFSSLATNAALSSEQRYHET